MTCQPPLTERDTKMTGHELKCTLVALAVLAALGCVARADQLAYEGFSYEPAGAALLGQEGAGSMGFASAWREYDPWDNPAVYAIASGSLADPACGLLNCGNHVTSSGCHWEKNVYIARTLGAAIGYPGTTTYVSFLLRPEGTLGEGIYGGYFGLELFGSGTVLFVGKPGTGATNPYLISDLSGGGAQSTTVVPQAGRTDLLVLRADFDVSGTLDSFKLYVNPVPGAEEPALADAVKVDSDVGTVTTIRIDGGGAFCIDEIRLGSTYADVTPVPEPSILLLLLAPAAFAAGRARFFLRPREGMI
jgi:hypothetical protein